MNATVLERLLSSLCEVHSQARRLALAHRDAIDAVPATYRPGAENLCHYVALRQHDLRPLQDDLARLGLSSLGRMEAHTLANLEAVIRLLTRLGGTTPAGFRPEAHPVSADGGSALLQRHTRDLLGREPERSSGRVMVTMPTLAAEDPAFLADLVEAGMSVMRINTAHDDPDAWNAMIDNLRRVDPGRACRVLLDLAGPKLRTGPLPSPGRIVRVRVGRDGKGDVIRPGRLWLTDREGPEAPPPGAVPVEVAGEFLRRIADGDVCRIRDRRGRWRRAPMDPTVRGDRARLVVLDRGLYLEEGATIRLLRNGEEVASTTAGGLSELTEPLLLSEGDRLLVTPPGTVGRHAERDEDGRVVRTASIPCTLPEALDAVLPGQPVWFDDGKIGGVVCESGPDGFLVELTSAGSGTVRLRPEKGINLPETRIATPALSDADVENLERLCHRVDMVGLSFVRDGEDVHRLARELERLDARHLGLIVKIETQHAIRSLPKILLAALASPPTGVMIARGDLAVEVGLDRLAEVQEEILWFCEAAHVPVVWATQVLESLVKKGAPSRAEVSDAAHAVQAECVMLNKGPHVVDGVRFLDAVLRRMQDHQTKKRSMLRRLHAAEL